MIIDRHTREMLTSKKDLFSILASLVAPLFVNFVWRMISPQIWCNFWNFDLLGRGQKEQSPAHLHSICSFVDNSQEMNAFYVVKSRTYTILILTSNWLVLRSITYFPTTTPKGALEEFVLYDWAKSALSIW